MLGSVKHQHPRGGCVGSELRGGHCSALSPFFLLWKPNEQRRRWFLDLLGGVLRPPQLLRPLMEMF